MKTLTLTVALTLGWANSSYAQGLTTTFFAGSSCAPLPDNVFSSRLQRSLRLEDLSAWSLPAGLGDFYTVRMSGMFRASTTGTYVFRFDADDGLIFTVNSLDRHRAEPPRGSQIVDVPIFLEAGDHVIELCHIEAGGPLRFVVQVQVPGATVFSDITPAQLIYDPGFGPSATVVDFDALPAGTYLTNSLEASDGIIFSTQLGSDGFYYSRPRVVAAGPATTASLPNVLQNESFDAIEATNVSANVPLLIRFTVPQSHVSIETGTQVNLPLRPDAVLKAFNSAGELVAAHRLNSVSPSIIHRLHVLRGASDISLISLDHGLSANDERVDGFRFEAFNPVAPPTDTEAPVVEFIEPNASSVRSAGTLRVIVRVRENSGALTRVQALSGAASADLEPDGTPDPLCVPPICGRYVGGLRLSNGAQTIRVEAEDAAGNVGTEMVSFDFVGVTEVEIVDEAGDRVVGADLFVDGRPRPYSVDPDGVIRLFPPLAQGSQLAARIRLGESSTYRSNHSEGSAQNWNFRTYLTSVTIEDDGRASTNVVGPANERQRVVIRRDNVLFGLHWTVALEWDATDGELERVRANVQDASDFLYNATDGQFVIEQAELTDQAREWGDVDMRVYARDMRAFVNSHTGSFLGANVIHSTMHLSRTDPGDTYAHEFGHYGLDLKDEYRDDDAGASCTQKGIKTDGGPLEQGGVQASCMMWRQWRAPKLCSDHPSNPHVRGLRQGDTSCWDKLAQRYGNPLFTLKTPTTRGAIPASVTPPVSAWRQLRSTVRNLPGRSARCRSFSQQFLRQDGLPFANAQVWLRGPGGGVLQMGFTDSNGSVDVFGAHVGDVLLLQGVAAPAESTPDMVWRGANPTWQPGGPAVFEVRIPVSEALCAAP